MKWLKQRALNTPTAIQAAKGKQIPDAMYFAQFGKAFGNAIHRKDSCCAPVSGLGFGVCPTHVSRLVIFTRINAVYFHAFRALSKLFKKAFEITSPRFMHGHASAAVVMIFVAIWICASLNHVVVRHVSSGVSRSPCVSMSDPFELGTAATGNGSSTFQGSIADDFFSTTDTDAKTTPKNSSALGDVRLCVCNNFQLSKALSNEGFSGRHNDGRYIVVFSGADQHQLNGFAHLQPFTKEASSAINVLS